RWATAFLALREQAASGSGRMGFGTFPRPFWRARRGPGIGFARLPLRRDLGHRAAVFPGDHGCEWPHTPSRCSGITRRIRIKKKREDPKTWNLKIDFIKTIYL